MDGYKPRLNALTGEGQGHAAALNVAAGNVSKLEISLVPSEPQVEVEHLKIRHIYLQVFDIEDGKSDICGRCSSEHLLAMAAGR